MALVCSIVGITTISWLPLNQTKADNERSSMNNNKNQNPDSHLYKISAVIRAAEELCYGKDVIAALKAAKTQSEVCRIMTTARNRG